MQSPGHISFCICCKDEIRVSLLLFRFEDFYASVVCPFVFLQGAVYSGYVSTHWPLDAFMDIRITQKNLGRNQRTPQSLHVRVENVFD